LVETKEATPRKKERSAEGGQERQELPHLDRVALLRGGGSEARGLNSGTESATRYLPALSIDHGSEGRGAAPGQNNFRSTDGSQSAHGAQGANSHEVQQGESLWRIARRSLRESGAPSGNQDIEKAVKQIVELNKKEHPSLGSNPDLIQAGWNLKMPPGMGAGNLQPNGRPDLYKFDGGGGQRQPFGGSGDSRGGQFGGPGDSRGGQFGGPGDSRGGQFGRPGDQRGGQFGAAGEAGAGGGAGQYGGVNNQFDNACNAGGQFGGDGQQYGNSGNRFGVQQQFGFPWQQYGQERQQPGMGGQYGAGGQFGGDNFQNNFQGMANPFQGISDLASSLRDAAIRTASGMGGSGRCAAGVQVALARMGHGQWMGSGNAWDMGAKMARSGNFDMLPLAHAREGDIVVRSWNNNVIAQHGGRNHGDIVVVTGADKRGNLMGANDHHGRIAPDGGRYQNSYVLRFRDYA
jgi:hypothetical protein